MRILFFGDLATTGFGTVTTDLGRAMLTAGADVRFVSQNELGALEEPFLSRTLEMATFAMSMQGYITDLLAPIRGLLNGQTPAMLTNGQAWGAWKPEAVLLLGDFAAVRLMTKPWLQAFREVPTFHYCPVEGVDLPPSWKEFWDVLHPVAMSEFGAAQIERVMGERPPMIYHGVDSDVFYPVSRSSPIRVVHETHPALLQTKAACKRYLGLNPELTLLLRTDRLMPRKRYASLLRSVAPVLAAHSDVALMILCDIFDQGGYLPDEISKYSEAIQRRVLIKDASGPASRQDLLILYNAADLYVSSGAEGFGLTIAESLACGVPAVAAEYSAVPEVIGPAGAVVPLATVLMGDVAMPLLIDNEYQHAWCGVDERAFARKVDELVSHRQRREDLGRRGPRHVQTNFRWDHAAQQFLELFGSAAQAQVAA